MPITSLLVLPMVQGTTIPYLLALGSTVLICLKISQGRISVQVTNYVRDFLTIAALWLILFGGSQLADMGHPQADVQDMFTLSPETGLLMRSSMFTQSLYLLACAMIALYFRHFFREEWMVYAYWGGWLFAIYGLYDWAFYLVFHFSGDFLANRTFAGGDHPGSWSQTIDLAGLQLLRLKSCLGEPSFVAAVVVPYLFMAIDGRKRLLTALLLATALLTTSTAVYLTTISAFFIQMLWSKHHRTVALGIFAIVTVALAAMAMLYPDLFYSLFGQKLSGDNESGRMRMDSVLQFEDLFSHFTLMNWLFGVGFGYLYFTLCWSLTANTGLLGVTSFLYAFLKPVFLLGSERGSEWLRISLVALIIAMTLSVSELFLPTTWMFLGLAYRRLDLLREQRSVASVTAFRFNEVAREQKLA
jgi:hypothetical protein